MLANFPPFQTDIQIKNNISIVQNLIITRRALKISKLIALLFPLIPRIILGVFSVCQTKRYIKLIIRRFY